MSIRRALGWTRRLIARAPFEAAVVALALVYVALHLSGSSYSLALDQLGADDKPLIGQPRGIRTDEWSVTTPLFQIAVNNDFQEQNETSFYRETLRSHIGLPLLNWALAFKPLVLPFFLVPPALAYSFYWAANAALMLIGWSLLLRVFGFSRLVAGATSALLYLSPFVQAWGGPAPHLSLFPWVLLAVVCIASRVWLAVALALLIPTWLISMFFVSALAPLFPLALALCVAFRREALSRTRLPFVIAGISVGLLITFAYFHPVLSAYSESEYPGNRWARGGEMSLWHVLSQVLPGTTTEGYVNLIADNISEAASVATWLPLLTLCVLDFSAIRRRLREGDRAMASDIRSIAVLVGMLIVISAWQLVPIPPLSYLFGLGLSPGSRTLFASGALLLVAAAYALDRLPLRLTLWRLSAFAAVVVGAWLAARIDLRSDAGVVLRDELFVLIIVVGLIPFTLIRGRPSRRATQVAVALAALLPTALAWGLFNPIQSTRVMFEKPETAVTRRLDMLAAQRPDGAIAVEGIPDAILNGVGYRSVTHVIVTPSPETFRKYFPDMEERRFNRIFNRFAHYGLTDAPMPFVLSVDNVRLPIRTMSRHAATFDE